MGPTKRPLSATDFEALDSIRRAKLTVVNDGSANESARSPTSGSPAQGTEQGPATSTTVNAGYPAAPLEFDRQLASNGTHSFFTTESPSPTDQNDLTSSATAAMRDWTVALTHYIEAHSDQSNALKRLEEEKANFERMKPNYAVYRTFEETNRNSLNFAKKWNQDAHDRLVQDENTLHQLTARLIPQWTRQDAVLKRPAFDENAFMAELKALKGEMATKNDLIDALAARVKFLEERPVQRQIDPKVEERLTLAADTSSKLKVFELKIDHVEKSANKERKRLDQVEAKARDVETNVSDIKSTFTRELSSLGSKVGEAEEKVSLTSNRVASLQKQTNEDLKSIQSSVKNIETSSRQGAATTNDKVRTLEMLDEHILEYKNRTKALESKVQTVIDGFTELNEDHNSITNQGHRLDSLAQSNRLQRSQIEATEEKVKTIATSVEHLTTALQNLASKDQVDLLSRELGSIKEGLDSDRTVDARESEKRGTLYSTMMECIVTQESRMSDMQREVAKLHKAVKPENEPVDQVQSQVQECVIQLATMQKQLEALQSQAQIAANQLAAMQHLFNARQAESPAKSEALVVKHRQQHDISKKPAKLTYPANGLFVVETSLQKECGSETSVQTRGFEPDTQSLPVDKFKMEINAEVEAKLTEARQSLGAEALKAHNQLRASLSQDFQKWTARLTTIEQRVGASIPPEQIREVRELKNICDGLARAFAVLQQRYDYINTDQLAQQMLNQLSLIFPAPLALQHEANQFAEARRDVLAKLQDIDALKDRCLDAKNKAVASSNTVYRLEGTLSALDSDLNASRSQVQDLLGRVGEMEENIQQYQKTAEGHEFTIKKLRAVQDCVVKHQGLTMISQAIWAD